jgi:putative ABC transport system permease protein
LRPGIAPSKAQAELELLGTRFAREFPAENREWTIGMVPLRQMIAGGSQPALLVLLGAVGLVLLIACANIANLLLARATSRASEMAVRATLGAGSGRLIRQLLSESALLGLIGGFAGIVLAYAGVRGLSSLLPSTLPRANTIGIDSFVLAFALVLAVAASLAFGLAPALIIAKSSLQAKLREGSVRSGESRKSRFARNALAVAEITIATVLLLGSGLLLRSFSKLTSVDPGFRAQHLVKAEISLPQFQYSNPGQWAEFSERLLAGIHSEPGLQDSAIAVPIPLANRPINLGFDIVGNPSLSSSSSRTADYASVSPEYFQVMGVPLVAGRFFDQRDKLSSLPVSIISSAMARIYFPHQNPIGKQLIFGFPPRAGFAHEIVGVVGDLRDAALGEAPSPIMYVPYMQEPFWGGNLVIRSRLSTSSVVDAVRRETEKIDKNLPVTGVAAMPDILNTSVAQPKFQALLLTTFAAIALVLAATGIFGVIAYSVSCRTQEIGIRLAVGASRGTILWMISRQTLVLTMAGLAVGIPCALAASHLLGHMLFGISAEDPATLVFTTVALAVVAALAGYLPARRATRVDPVFALRYQ